MDGNGLYTELAACPLDAQSNLTAIGYKNLLEHLGDLKVFQTRAPARISSD